MISEHQKQDIYHQAHDLVCEAITLGYAPETSSFYPVLKVLFEPLGVQLKHIERLTIQEIFEEIIECCEILRKSTFETKCALDCLAPDAHKLFY